MDIYLEFRITSITDNGYVSGITNEDIENAIRWKMKPFVAGSSYDEEGSVFDLFPIGLYQDSEITTLIVEAHYTGPMLHQVVVDTQVGGFVPRMNQAGTELIENIPLHITTDIPGVSLNPMEGGIRAAGGYTPWLGDSSKIATVVIEANVVRNLYEYIAPACNDIPEVAIP